MSTMVLFEDYGHVNLLPLVWWRSVFELRWGRKIILDRSAQRLGLPVAGVWTRGWLAKVAAQRCGAPANTAAEAGTVLVNGRWIAEGPVDFPRAPALGVIDEEVVYVVCDVKLAARLAPTDLLDRARQEAVFAHVERYPAAGRLIRYPWDLVGDLSDALINDWQKEDASIDVELNDRVTIEGVDKMHIGERSRIHPTAVIDASTGPVFISHDVQIGACAVVEGPVYIGPGTRVNPHALLRGGNVVGPVCKVGGEINGCTIDGYTNKQHLGFLGHSYIGSWVNFGAGSTGSNLKNTFGSVRVPINGKEIDTGRTFFGAIIGDHAKIGINAAIPTGAVIGFSAMAASGRVLHKYLPSFGWFTDDGLRPGDPGRLLDAATRMMARRDVDMTDDEVELFLELGTRVTEIEAGHSSHPRRSNA